MRPKSFDYHQSSTVEQAIDLLESLGEEAKVLAGGLSLVPMMKLRLAAPEHVIDITKIPTLSYVTEGNDGSLSIGGLTAYRTLAESKLVQSKCPILAEVSRAIGDVQVRNRGTVAGNLAHADPSSDLTPVILALNAELVTVGSKGERTIKADDFFLDFFTTSLQPTELLVEIRIPAMLPNTGGAYKKLTQRAGDYAIASSAVVMTLDQKDICKTIRVVLGSVASVPGRAKQTEEALLGKRLKDDLIEESSELASQGIQPPADVHATSEYRTEMAKVMTKRALQEAMKRAR